MKGLPTALVVAVLAVLAFLAVTGLASAAPDELLTNGGFEDGADYWQEASCTFSVTADPSLVFAGGVAAALTDESGAGWIRQTVQIEPGATYTLSGWAVKNDQDIEAVFLRVGWCATCDGFGDELAYAASPRLEGDADGFRALAVSAKAPPDAHSARVECVVEMVRVPVGPATAYFDDVSFTGLPPSTPTPCATPTPASTAEPTVVASPTPAATPTPYPTPKTTPLPTPTPVATAAASPVPTFTPGPTPTPDGTKADTGDVLINEVQYDPPQSGHAEHDFEWAEVYNPAQEDIELRGWTVSDNVEIDPVPPLSIPQGGFAIIAASEGFCTDFPDFEGTVVFVEDGRLGNGLSNDGDRLLLADGSGKVIDAISYGDDFSLDARHSGVAEGHSVERSPPGGGLVDNPHPTPGQGLYPGATPTSVPTPVVTPEPTPRPSPTVASTPADSETATATPPASPTAEAGDGGASSGVAVRAILIVAAIACLGVGFWLRRRSAR